MKSKLKIASLVMATIASNAFGDDTWPLVAGKTNEVESLLSIYCKEIEGTNLHEVVVIQLDPSHRTNTMSRAKTASLSRQSPSLLTITLEDAEVARYADNQGAYLEIPDVIHVGQYQIGFMDPLHVQFQRKTDLKELTKQPLQP